VWQATVEPWRLLAPGSPTPAKAKVSTSSTPPGWLFGLWDVGLWDDRCEREVLRRADGMRGPGAMRLESPLAPP